MSGGNEIKDRSFDFSLRIVKLSQSLPENNTGFVIGKQILRSGTSIGANIEEAIAGSSKKDFKHKMSIALKEARETNYWLRLLKESEVVAPERLSPLINESVELKKMLASIVKSVGDNGDAG